MWTILNNGTPFRQFKTGFFRSEGGGVYRIGQSGVNAAKEMRLYVHPDEKKELIYILGIGTKGRQEADIAKYRRTVKEIREEQNAKPVGEGVSEMRVDYGSGYRVYFKKKGRFLFVLLAGGDKRSQRRDIAVALRLARNL